MRAYRNRVVVLTAVTLSSAFAQASKPAPKPKNDIQEIKATGCVKATTGRCFLLVTLDGKTTYSFIAAPKPDVGSVVTIDATPHRGAFECKQGIAIDLIDWQPVGDSCAER